MRVLKPASLCLTLLALTPGGFACIEPPTVNNCPQLIPKFPDVAIWPKCTSCHSSNLPTASRQRAPLGVDYDVYASAVAHSAKTVDQVQLGRMPPPGTNIPAVTATEMDSLTTWVLCGQPQ